MWAQVNELLFKNFFQYSVSAGLWRPSTEYCRVADTRPNRVAEPSIGSALMSELCLMLFPVYWYVFDLRLLLCQLSNCICHMIIDLLYFHNNTVKMCIQRKLLKILFCCPSCKSNLLQHAHGYNVHTDTWWQGRSYQHTSMITCMKSRYHHVYTKFRSQLECTQPNNYTSTASIHSFHATG